MTSDPDVDCNYSVTETQANIYVATTLGFAVIGSLGCIATIVMVLLSKAYRSYIHRLTLYLAISSLFAALSTGITVLPVDTSSVPTLSLRQGSGWNDTCVTFAFLVQYFIFSSTFATLWISSNVFSLVTCRMLLNQRRCDIAGLLFTFVLPLLVAWIPFIGDTFGLTTVWCWVKNKCYKGSKHSIGFQFGATVGPVFIMYLGSLVLIMIVFAKFIAGLLGKRGNLRHKHWEVLKELMPLVIYALACCVVYMFGLFSTLYFVLYDKYHGAVAVAVMTCSLQTVRFLLPIVVLLQPSVKHRIAATYRGLVRREAVGDKAATAKVEAVEAHETSTLIVPDIFDSHALGRLLEDITSQNEVKFVDEKSVLRAYEFPDFSASPLSTAAMTHIAQDLSQNIARAVSSVAETPALILMKRQSLVWRRVVSAREQHTYSEGNMKRALAAVQGTEAGGGGSVDDRKQSDVTEPLLDSPEKRTGNDVLVELGVKTGLTVVFALLRQSWSQLTWQRLIEQQLPSGSYPRSLPQPSLPNEVLRSVLLVLKGIPPLSLSNLKSFNNLSACCLEQSTEFLYSIAQADACVDREGKRLACEIMLTLVLQQGTLGGVLTWVERMLSCLAGYLATGGKEVQSQPCALSMESCLEAVEEIRKRTRLHGAVIHGSPRPFAPQERTPEGHVMLIDFLLHLCDELSHISADCTRCLSEDMGAEPGEKPFVSETCDVYAFGSNSSSQLAMGSTEKLVKASLLPHMANCQLVEAGQYCTFVIFGDGVMKGCGKGSYGRLGLGSSDSEPTLKAINTFPPGMVIRKVASSRGSDGHSLAITGQGKVYSWGDGNYGKLGHGDHITQKLPKLIEALSEKVVRQVACGNRHSAAITADGELYTWGEGDYGRLGHGTTASVKVPTKVAAIELVQQVACGAAHTLVLSMDGLTVWSFGSGDLGKLGHGDTNRQTLPKVIEGLRGMVCQKVCAGSQFSIVLTAGGRVYSFGNGSGVGKGTTEPRQYTPWLIESLGGEVIIDVATGDGHCLALTQRKAKAWREGGVALTQRGEVYAWGTNSMGQCGQGHSNGSITIPSKVVGLEGVQIQQISAGTSHSLVWTAVPLDRRASALWNWPYCVSVGESTYAALLSILNKYGCLDSPYPVAPFRSKQAQESLVYSMMSLLRTHLKLSAPLGPQCVHMACGDQVKDIRSFLFKLIDSELPMAIDQVTTEALVVGAPILVPPVLERVKLLLDTLPREPSDFSALTSGQRRQIDLLLAGLDEGFEIVGLIVDKEWLEDEEEAVCCWVCTEHVEKLFALCELAAKYIFEATMHALDKDNTSRLPEPVQLGSSLLKRFERLVTSVYCNIVTFMTIYLDWGERSYQLLLPLSDRKGVLIHFAPFYHILKDLSLHVLSTLVENLLQSPDPLAYLRAQRDVQFGFLAHQFPSHIALTTHIVPAFDVIFNVGELLLEMAAVVHQAVLLLPPDVVLECEKRELQWEPVYLKPENSELVEERETEALQYPVGKDKLTLISSGLVRNGGVSGLTHALYNWMSLCKTIHQPGGNEERDRGWWTDYLEEYMQLKACRTPLQPDLFLTPDMIGPCDPSITIPLFALAVGATGNLQAEEVYERMMEFAKKRDWNTWSDEGSLPQLRQTSCAALACCLHHSGLLSYAIHCKSSPKKQLVTVYRAVFALRREVFIHRPLASREGNVEPVEQKQFEAMCRGICFTLFFLMCVLSPALPEEADVEANQVTVDCVTAASYPVGDLGPESHNKPHADVGHEDDTNSSDPLSASSSSELFDWSQPSMKQAWSLLSMRRQKDRGDTPHATSLSSEEDLTKKVTWSIVAIVCQIFKKGVTLLNRVNLDYALTSQHRRATDRRDALTKVARFLEKVSSDDALLLSSKLIYLSNCLNHSIHYSQNISVAAGELQKEIETLYHVILRKIVGRVHGVEPSDIKGPSSLVIVREFLLVLQWTSFQHNPSDILLLFDGDFLSKIVAFSGVVTPNSCDIITTDSRLCFALQQGCEQLLKLLALRVGINANDLKGHTGILSKVSALLYGQLEGYICQSDPRVSEQWYAKGVCAEQRETELGEFLCFLGTLLASGGYLCAVMVMERLASMLLKVVGLGTGVGQQAVSSLKTRLLALQVMEMVVCGPGEEGFGDLSKCVEIVESLFALMYRSAVECSVLPYQEGLSQLQRTGAEADCEMPCAIDPSWQHNCSIAMEGRTALVVQESCPGYAIGLVPLANGRYTWKVSAESTKPTFFVGLALKRLTPKGIQSSNDVWVLDAASGHLYHGGKKGDTLFVLGEEGGTITVEFDCVARTLSFGKNDEPLKVAFQEISQPSEDLFPALFFNKKSATTRVRLHPILKQTKMFVSSIRRREHLASGFPLLSSTGVTVTQSVISLLYKLQEKQPWAQAIGSVLHRRLEELGHTSQSFSSLKTRCSSGPDSDPLPLVSLGNLLGQALQTLWPCLALIGGMDTGLYIGRECQVGREDVEGAVTVVSVPNAQQEVLVQEQVTNTAVQVTKRRVPVSDLKLSDQRKFLLSLITPWFSPSMLMDIVSLSGVMGDSHNISAIISSAQSSPHMQSSLQITSSPVYLKLCHSILQLSATKCLHTLLFDEGTVTLLLDHTSSHPVVDHTSPQHPNPHCGSVSQSAGSHQVTVPQQGSSRGENMTSVLRIIVGHLAQCAIQPSPLRPALTMAELDRLHSVLVCETLRNVAEHLSQQCGTSCASNATSHSEAIPDAPGSLDEREEPPSSDSPPPVLDVLADMGFPTSHIRIALDRCGLPAGVSLQVQMETLVSWIIDHPNLLGMLEEVLDPSEGELGEEEEEGQIGEEPAQNQAGMENNLITELLENEELATVSNESTKHAPDLLEGPSPDNGGFDISIAADHGALQHSSLLSALQKGSIPDHLKFPLTDPLGESLCQTRRGPGDSCVGNRKEDTPDGFLITHPLCSGMVAQAQDLRSPEECVIALQRVSSALCTVVSRRVAVFVLCAAATYPPEEFLANLGMLKLDSSSFLIGLLRLVHASRIDGTPGTQFGVKLRTSLLPVLAADCLCAAIKAVSSLEPAAMPSGPQATPANMRSSGGHRLVQTCCQDLVAAAVGGADALAIRGRWGKSHVNKVNVVDDVSVLSRPNFSVSQSLVQGMIDATVAASTGSAEVVGLANALAACIVSSKLQREHKLWALKQMLRLLGAVEKKEDVCKEGAILPSSLEHLIGHKGQIMACVQNDKAQSLISIAEDSAVVLWNMVTDSKHPEMTVLPLHLDVSGEGKGYPLPVLAQNSLQVCVGAALNQSLCVLRVKDGQMTSSRLPDLITALEWKKGQVEGDSPTLLVGLVSGQLLLAAVLRISMNLTPEIHTAYLEPTLKGAICSVSWSPSGHLFMAASTSALHMYSQPSTLGSTYTLICSEGCEVVRVDWSPVDAIVASLERNSCALQIWDVGQGHLVSVYRSSDLRITQIAWHPVVSKDGAMLLGGGSRGGAIYLWTVDSARDRCNQKPAAGVHFVAILNGHSAPVTSLVFSASGALLASGCQAGSVRVWDMMTNQLLKLVTPTVGEVLNLCWTDFGLAICYKNTNTLCLLPPGPQDYLGERSVFYAHPTLSRYGVSQLDKAPCLAALLKHSLLILADQRHYELSDIASGCQVTHSEYLQSLVALVVGLDLHRALLLPLHPTHLPPDPVPADWQWLGTLSSAIAMAQSLTKRLPFPTNAGLPCIQGLDPDDPYQPTDNLAWTLKMDAEIVEWAAERPLDWWQLEAGAAIHTWGRGTAHQLGHSAAESVLPDRAGQWEEDVRLVVAGNLCTYGVKFDGSVWSVGEGLRGRLGHGSTIGETNMRLIGALQGIPVVHVVAGPRVSAPIDEGFALALTNMGEVYSWGRGFGGHLGHTTSEDICAPKRIESLVGMEIKMIAACDRHCAALTTSGQLYLFGLSDHGQLGQGQVLTNQLDQPVVQVTQFLDSDECTQLDDVRIGYVCCGQSYTVAVSESGSEVFACGSSECGSFGTPLRSGDHHRPYLLSHLAPFGPYLKCAAGRHVTALITLTGKVCWFGKLCEGMGEQRPEFLQLPGEEKVIDVQIAYDYMLLLTESGCLYSMGKTAPGTCLLGYEVAAPQCTPKLIERLSGKCVKQISAGPSHAAASNVPCTHTQREAAMCLVPLSVPTQYSSLRDVPCRAIHARFRVLNQFSRLILSSWRLFGTSMYGAAALHINPLAEASTRLLISPTNSQNMFEAVINKTTSVKTHGPTITVNRAAQESHSKLVFPQIATQIVQKPPSELRCSSRAWKVTLVGEAADDAGGVFDETIALMCEELQSNTLDLLVPTPNARNKCGFNMDRYVFNPRCTSPKKLRYLKFLGIMLGVAIRTKKPLALHLAQPIWKLLAGMTLTAEDLEEMDLMFIRTMFSIQGVHTSGVKEEEFSELIPIEFFEAEDMNGHFVPIVPGGGHNRLTFHNRQEYVEKAIHFRLHELDQQVAAVREGMASIVPVPLLSLYTARMLEVTVCGSEQVDIQVLKKVARYRDGISESDDIIRWLWQTLDSFTNEEKVLFLRFVSGRSRLPARVSEITQRFKIMKGGETTDALPTAQTCFFQIRLPVYRSQQVMAERLRYAIRNCRSIDMDNYMLRRTIGEWENDEEL
ncbi:hypothetical protein EMCRGX_G021569 [Ephydatia muelleri]